MQFEPKIIRQDAARPEDAPPQLAVDPDLPDDLAMLAEQLFEDAKHLAARFPADGSGTPAQRPQPAAARTSWRRWVAVASSVAAVLVVGVSLYGAWQMYSTADRGEVQLVNNHDRGNSPADRTVTVVRDGATDQAVSPGTLSPGTSAELAVSPPDRAGDVAVDESVARQENTPLLPPAMLWNMSGPELEGMLDLLEHENADDATLAL